MIISDREGTAFDRNKRYSVYVYTGSGNRQLARRKTLNLHSVEIESKHNCKFLPAACSMVLKWVKLFLLFLGHLAF